MFLLLGLELPKITRKLIHEYKSSIKEKKLNLINNPILKIPVVNKGRLKRRVKDLPRGNDRHFPKMSQPSQAV